MTVALQWLIRLLGVVQLVLGLMFWSNNQLSLIPLHMLLGVILVLCLWVQAAVNFRTTPIGLVATAFIWGLITAVFGMNQDALLPGDAHWIIKVLHLIVGLAAVGIAEAIAARAKRAMRTATV